MNIYLIGRPGRCGYDEYYSAVVVAPTEESARLMHPGGYEWDATAPSDNCWIAASAVIVTIIGKSKDDHQRVVCASFNAG